MSIPGSSDIRPRVLSCFLAALWGAVFLAKFYGIASMRLVTVGFALPATVLLLLICRWARQHYPDLAAALLIGAIGGLLGTVAYDLVRVPFVLGGQRIFAPISAYGLWILEADQSSRFSEVVGWLYHFINGISFGILYALCCQGRHWAWAILWGFILETIAIGSPFGTLFMMRTNSLAIAAAYLGHVAYGIPLGFVVQQWRRVETWLNTVPPFLWWSAALIVTCAIVGPMLSPELIGRDVRRTAGALRVEGSLLNPNWIRIQSGHEVVVVNPGDANVRVRFPRTGDVLELGAGSTQRIGFARPGIYPAFVETTKRSHSSFVIVEPVERAE